jgi:hypothetical protein
LGVAVALEMPDGEISHPASSAPQSSAQSMNPHAAQSDIFLETISTSSLENAPQASHPLQAIRKG